MPFNKAVKKLIKAQGRRGLELLTIMEDVEKYYADPYDEAKLIALMVQCPWAVEYQEVIQNGLENYTTDIAEGTIRYGVPNGVDAWRKLYHHYVPLAEDFQQI